MKNLLIVLLLAPLMALAQNASTEGAARVDKNVNAPIPADAVVLVRQQLGSGTPGFTSFEPATSMGEGIYHAPQYLSAYPTAGTLWPRVIDVQCDKTVKGYVCDGYNWLPAMGRGEYLYIRPSLRPVPRIVEKLVPTPVIVEKPYPVYVEIKKKKE